MSLSLSLFSPWIFPCFLSPLLLFCFSKGHDDAAPCAVLKRVDSFSFLQHPVHQRSLEILQRCKEEKHSKAASSTVTPPTFTSHLGNAEGRGPPASIQQTGACSSRLDACRPPLLPPPPLCCRMNDLHASSRRARFSHDVTNRVSVAMHVLFVPFPPTCCQATSAPVEITHRSPLQQSFSNSLGSWNFPPC